MREIKFFELAIKGMLMIYAVVVIALFIGCVVNDNIQVDGFVGKMFKKEWVYRYPNYQAVQYWRSIDGRGFIYEQHLEPGDTGYSQGMVTYILIVKR